MQRIFFFVTIVLSSCTSTYYVVRHAEKEAGSTMAATTLKTSDVPLSLKGERRAEALKDSLFHKHAYLLWSTNTIRTKSTIEPYRQFLGNKIKLYSNDSLKYHIENWKRPSSTPLVIIGHSNTVDDIVNGLVGKNVLQDLPDSQYGDMFIVKRKRGPFKTKTSFHTKHFGE